MRHVPTLSVLVALGVAGCGDSSILFQPDSATASSSWSDAFVIENAINGSGLPRNFGPDDTHGLYRSDTHWSTEDGDVAGAWAWFEFDRDVTIDSFYMWNHRSTSPPAFSENYAITRFDLELFDADDRRLLELRDLRAEKNRADAQVFDFDSTDEVRSVRLSVLENAGEPRVTGLAEVAFGGSP